MEEVNLLHEISYFLSLSLSHTHAYDTFKKYILLDLCSNKLTKEENDNHLLQFHLMLPPLSHDPTYQG